MCLLFSCLADAQKFGGKIDSLIQVADNAKGDSVAIANCEVGHRLSSNYPLDALPFLEKAYESAISSRNYATLCQVCSFLGIASRRLGNYTMALKYFEEQLNVARDNSIMLEVAWAQINLGNLFVYMKNYDMASQYLMEALDCAEKYGDDNLLAFVYRNLGRLNLLAMNYDDALSWQKKALTIRRKHLEEPVNIAVEYRDIGNIYFKKKLYDGCKFYYDQCLEIVDTLPENDLPGGISQNLAFIYLDELKLDSALIFARKAMLYAVKYNSKPNIRDAHKILGDVYYAMGDYVEAEKHFSLQILYNDSVNSSDVAARIFELQCQNEQYHQRQSIKTVDDDLKRQKLIGLVILSLLMSAILVAAILYHKKNMIEKINKTLDAKNTLLVESIDYARRIQNAVFPNFSKVGRNCSDKFLISRSEHVVSGDFYWYHETPKLELLAVADSGKQGVPGGFLGMLGSTMLHDIALTTTNPSEILNQLKSRIMDSAISQADSVFDIDSMDISIMVVERQKSKLYYSSLSLPLIYVRGGKLYTLQGSSQSCSLATKIFETSELSLELGDRIYMMTHGYCDQRGGNLGEKFSFESFCDMVLEIHGLPMQEQRETMERRLDDWRAGSNLDFDITVAGFVFE